jgi:DNA-binding NtrC family response regulator
VRALDCPPPSLSVRLPVSNPLILVVDDEPDIRETLTLLLEGEGYRVRVAASRAEALAALASDTVSCVLSDIRMRSEVDAGVRLLRDIRQRWPDVPVLLMTGYATAETAMEAVNLGAFHYLTKPYAPAEVLRLVKRATDATENKREEGLLRIITSPEVVGPSAAFQAALRGAMASVSGDAVLLLEGEPGAGKEVVAGAVHAGAKRKGLFVVVGCGHSTEADLERELFGVAATSDQAEVKGAFRDAEHGTLYLDEVGAMPPGVQVRLLRALQCGEAIPVGGRTPYPITARVIVANRRPLREAVESGHFRQGLYYRLKIVHVVLPALRDRPEDIAPIAQHLAARSAARRGTTAPAFAHDFISRLVSHRWPGNVRELENVVERAGVTARSLGASTLTAAHLPPLEDLVVDSSEGDRVGWAPAGALPVGAVLEAMSVDGGSSLPALALIEQAYIEFVLRHTQNNKTRAAKILRIDPNTLARKLKSPPAMPDDDRSSLD